MIEELVKHIITIEGEPIPKGNRTINYKIKNVPWQKLKDKGARNAKKKWEEAMHQKDFVTLSLKSYMNKAGVKPMSDPKLNVWINMIYYFRFKKTTNAAEIKKDLDNVEKLFQDAITGSGLICDDSQITFKMIAKQVVTENPKVEILSIAASDSFRHFSEWITLQSSHATRRIYEHQIATLP